MNKRIDFEAHYITPELMELFSKRKDNPVYDPVNRILRYSDDFAVANPIKLEGLLKSPEERIADMEITGTDIQILSVPQGIELLEEEEEKDMCRIANNRVFDFMKRYPGRFSGYAALPLRNIDAGIAELERCMTQLGFFGWNAFSNFGSTAPDDDRYLPLFECAQALGAPVYIHPAHTRISRLLGLGQQLVGAASGFGIDTSVTLLRMIFKGVFDLFPSLKVIVGHLGEGLPFTMDRLNARTQNVQRAPAVNKEPAGYYFSRNIWVTGSGVFSYPSFRCALDVLGIERILFGSDYPYERPDAVSKFLSGLEFTDEEFERYFSKNAEQFFRLKI